MKFYFGKAVTQEELNDSDDLFEHNGSFFFYMLELENDYFTISDSVGRSVPFDKSEIRGLSQAIFIAEKAYEDQTEVSNLVSKRTDELEQLIQFLATNE